MVELRRGHNARLFVVRHRFRAAPGADDYPSGILPKAGGEDGASARFVRVDEAAMGPIRFAPAGEVEAGQRGRIRGGRHLLLDYEKKGEERPKKRRRDGWGNRNGFDLVGASNGLDHESNLPTVLSTFSSE